MGRKIEFLSALGFSEHFAEAIKDMLFESEEFDLAIYKYADGSGQNGNVRALKALNGSGNRTADARTGRCITKLTAAKSGEGYFSGSRFGSATAGILYQKKI